MTTPGRRPGFARAAVALARAGIPLALAAVAFALTAGPVAACSPLLEEPTIEALGPRRIILVGTTGAAVEGGRLFHVERSFNAGQTATPIVIAFKEGEPIGDCSYVVSPGQHLVIAPVMGPDGRLSADLGTLQAIVETDPGKRYIDEAIALFGEGMVPEPADAPSTGFDPGGILLVVLVASLAAAVASAFALRDPRRGTA